MAPDMHIGIDLGGTNIRGGLLCDGKIVRMASRKIDARETAEKVLEQVFQLTDELMQPSVVSIGIGVPGLVDEGTGVVSDVVNIPSWKVVPLRQYLQERYQMPACINNDANCFALGEFYFGKGQGYDSMIGLTIGTGMGSGIVINGKLYSGSSGGAGEFGMIDYKDKYYEYYSSGQFFQNVYGIDGEEVYKEALKGNEAAIGMYREMGTHLGNAIKTILYALDVDLIVLGGSVRHAYQWFADTMWESIRTTVFQRTATRLKIEVSELQNSGILGAAALWLNAKG